MLLITALFSGTFALVVYVLVFDLHRDIEKDPPHLAVRDRSSESGPCFSRNMMPSLNAKPGLHRSVSEWTSNNQQLSATAQHERHISNVIRQEGRTLRNETNFKVGSCFVGRAQRTRSTGPSNNFLSFSTRC